MQLLEGETRIEVTEQFLETFGTGTLLGTLLKNGGVPSLVVLVFPQASLSWCQAHNGPHQYIVNDYAIRCLLDDVLRLQEFGATVRLESVTRDPAE
jgi:hypothetical protein